MAFLELHSVNAYYGDVQVLNNISLTLQAKKITALVGANGAGKSTLINTISGIIKSYNGKIIFDGEDISKLPAHLIASKGIVQVPEGRRLFPFMSVYENLLLGAHNSRAEKDVKQSLDMVLELFPKLGQRLKQLSGTLSGGEQQMCAIARGLMAKPKLLLIDELSLGLAPLVVEQIYETVTHLNQTGLTILLVEQNVPYALGHAHKAYVLEKGTAVMEGGGKELLENERLKETYLGL